ncbi:MAG: DNA alkylation repair protein [Candidatus Nomurabacteria bacterium]|jgi:3-methyladenine DNA glycosylase AlkD|nr:DNA alkylation repair protein [Candidatus Nomurabacteria bacterium]
MDDIRKKLRALTAGNEEYAEFNRRIIVTGQEILGVRMPELRKLAKRLAGDMSADDVNNFIKLIDKQIYEEVLLAGLIIAYAKLTDREKISLTRQYLKYVDNWGQVDTAVDSSYSSLDWWNFAKERSGSPDEFTVRYGVVLMMNFIKSDKLHEVLRVSRSVKHDGYYVKMAVAWLYATAAVRDYELTLREARKLPEWTRKKALTKMLESYRFTPAQKAEIRKLRAMW